MAALIGMISNWPRDMPVFFVNQSLARQLEAACDKAQLSAEMNDGLDPCETLVASLAGRKNAIYFDFNSDLLIDRDEDGYPEYQTYKSNGVFAWVEGTVKIWSPTTKQFHSLEDFAFLNHERFSSRDSRFLAASFAMFCLVPIFLVMYRRRLNLSPLKLFTLLIVLFFLVGLFSAIGGVH